MLRVQKAIVDAVLKFLEEWNKKVAGVIITGSVVTRFFAGHSDIDVQLVLPEGIKWKERETE